MFGEIKLRKTNFVYAIIHDHVLQWFFPIHINRRIVKKPELALNSTHVY